MKEDNIVIKGLWIGNELSPNELLSINSYLHNNHTFELYVYDRIKNVTDGVTIKDANQIIPRSEIFTYSSTHHKKSVSMFSDLFRYKLLYEVGGWWSDLDAICIKPYDIDQDYAIMQEKTKRAGDRVWGGVLKCPINAPIMDYCYNKTKEMSNNIQKQKWAATGPPLLGSAVNEFGLNAYVLPTRYFSPIGYYEVLQLFTPLQVESDTFSVHLYNEVWSMYNISKNGVYPKDSLFESLKKRYAVRNNYLNLITEFITDLRTYGLKKGSKFIYSKLRHMYDAF